MSKREVGFVTFLLVMLGSPVIVALIDYLSARQVPVEPEVVANIPTKYPTSGIGGLSAYVKLTFLEYAESEQFLAPVINRISVRDQAGKAIRFASIEASSGQRMVGNVLLGGPTWYPSSKNDTNPVITIRFEEPSWVNAIMISQDEGERCLIRCNPPNATSLYRGTPTMVRVETKSGGGSFDVEAGRVFTVNL